MEHTREHTCGTVFLLNATVTTKNAEQTQYPVQPRMLFCGEICHATSRASRGSCLTVSETNILAVVVSQEVIAQRAIDPDTVKNVSISIEEIPLNICERQDCSLDW